MIFSCLLVLKGFINAFIVYIDFKNENFVLKAIKCLSNFVNERNSDRLWNRFSHFTKFIAPVLVILTGLNAARRNKLNSKKLRNTSSVMLQAREHVAGVWSLTKKTQLDTLLTWHIGVIESIDAESITFSYLQSNSIDKCHWLYPESATTLCTTKEQIIATGLSIE